MEQKRSDKTIGVIGTTVFHVVLLVLFMVLGLSSMPQEEEGILVALGDGLTGMGTYVPSGNAPSTQPTPPRSVPVSSTPPPASTPKPSRDNLLTQNVEEAPAISAEQKARNIAEQQRIEKERQLQAEIDRQRKIEQERQRQQELERQRIEEQERLKREEKARQAAEARNAVSGAFSNSGSASTSSGDAGGSGSQGALTGDAGSSSRTGTGKGSAGISFDLSGRSSSGSLPQPTYNIQEEGKVVVEITVDKNGVVTNAQPILRGSTIQNSYLWSEARKAALRARFNPDANAPAYQKGTITYHFVLN